MPTGKIKEASYSLTPCKFDRRREIRNRDQRIRKQACGFELFADERLFLQLSCLSSFRLPAFPRLFHNNFILICPVYIV